MHTTNIDYRPDSWLTRAGLLFGLILCIGAASSSAAQAQNQNPKKKKAEVETESGKIVSIDREKKGRTVLKIKKSSSEDELEVAITNKIPVSIKAKGDRDFLQAGAVLSGKVTLNNPVDVEKQNLNNAFNAFNALTIFNAIANETKNNEKLVGKDFTVYLGPDSPKTEVVPKQDDFNMNQYEVCGTIEGVDADGGILVDFGENGSHKVFLEPGITSVHVDLSDPQLLKEGLDVEVEGHTVKGKGFVPTKVNATLEEALTAEEYLATQMKKPTSGKAKAKARPKKARVENFDQQ